ncbi:MAG: hypothetical protein BGO77_03290 [Caedibacter sp. 37-49]|nr:MAG: hypothetical protein BGO77_03290 [Caedibacter sp. 37-49]
MTQRLTPHILSSFIASLSITASLFASEQMEPPAKRRKLNSLEVSQDQAMDVDQEGCGTLLPTQQTPQDQLEIENGDPRGTFAALPEDVMNQILPFLSLQDGLHWRATSMAFRRSIQIPADPQTPWKPQNPWQPNIIFIYPKKYFQNNPQKLKSLSYENVEPNQDGESFFTDGNGDEFCIDPIVMGTVNKHLQSQHPLELMISKDGSKIIINDALPILHYITPSHDAYNGTGEIDFYPVVYETTSPNDMTIIHAGNKNKRLLINDISFNGSVWIGNEDANFGDRYAFKWQDGQRRSPELPSLDQKTKFELNSIKLYSCSSDGTTIVGRVTLQETNNQSNQHSQLVIWKNDCLICVFPRETYKLTIQGISNNGKRIITYDPYLCFLEEKDGKYIKRNLPWSFKYGEASLKINKACNIAVIKKASNHENRVIFLEDDHVKEYSLPFSNNIRTSRINLSEDGNIIIGNEGFLSNSRPLVWKASFEGGERTYKMLPLLPMIENLLSPKQKEKALELTGISADGTQMVGSISKHEGGFHLYLPNNSLMQKARFVNW